MEKCYQLISRKPFEDIDFDPEELDWHRGIKKGDIVDFIVNSEYGRCLEVNYADEGENIEFEDGEEIYKLEFSSHYINIFDGVFLMNKRPSEKKIKLIKEAILNTIHLIQLRAIYNDEKIDNDIVCFDLKRCKIKRNYITTFEDVETIFEYVYEPKLNKI